VEAPQPQLCPLVGAKIALHGQRALPVKEHVVVSCGSATSAGAFFCFAKLLLLLGGVHISSLLQAEFLLIEPCGGGHPLWRTLTPFPLQGRLKIKKCQSQGFP